MQIETPLSPQPNSKIVFHGDLARFGEVTASGWTTADLLRASHHLRPGLRQAAANMEEYRIYVGEIVPGQEIEEIALWLRIPSGSTVHVVPVALGAKGRGMSIGKIAIGAAVVVGAIAGAVFTGGLSLAALGGYALGSAGFGLTWGALATFGALTMLSGVSGLISYHKKTDTSGTNSDASTSLSGTLNVASQGQCVPLIYGRSVRVGSTVISSGYSAEDWANTTANADADKNNNSGQITSGSSGDLGAKGGKSGSSGGASEAPNTLRSKAVVRIIDLIGEGPGVSLVDGAKSIYFNGTPLMAADGTYNFKGVQWDVRTGDPDQDPVTGFPASESATTVGTEVKQPNPVIQSLTSDTATAARVTIRIPALYTVDKTSGVLGTGPTLGLIIEVRPSGGSWQQVASDQFVGQKCTSDYQKSYRFDLPDSSSSVWDIRVTKTTPDSTDTSTACSLYFDAYDSISDHLMIYPNSAYIALMVDSAAFGSSVPSRTYDVTGKEVKIPANYDPVARTYATTGTGTAQGTWDGISWKVANAVDDPTWCLLDLLGSTRYGYSLPSSQLLQLSYSLFTASQYASQQIDDGFGSTECRYALNVCINQDGDAYKVLQQFAGSFRAMAYWTNGGIDVAVDMPQEPVMLVTNANVLDGNFSYEGTGGNGRHNHCRVSFVNRDTNSQTDYETYVDQLSVSSVGLRTSEIEGFGITSRGLARRTGRWKVDTELHQTQTVTYKTGIDHAGVMPGDVVAVADQYAQGARLGGRVWSGSTGTSVNLDSLFTPIPGTSYTLKLIADDGSVATSLVKSFEAFTGDDGVERTVAILTDSLPQPSKNTLWVLSEPTTYNTPQFMVLDNKETARGLYQITAISYDPGKYGRVENNDPFNAVSFSSLPQILAEPLPAPSNVVATDYTIGEGTTTIIRVEVGWTTPTSALVTGSRVRAVSQATGETLYYDAGDASTYNIDGLTPGIWTFSVQTIGTNGRSSAFVAGDAITVDGKEDAPAAVLGLTVIGGIRVLNSTWQPSPIRNLMHYLVDRAPDVGGQPGTFSTIAHATTNNFADTDHDVLVPNSSWWVRVAPVTTMGSVGAYCGAVKATTSYLITADLEQSIRDTAAYAQTLRDALTSPNLVDGLPDVSGYANDSVVANTQENGRLYQLKNGQWVPMVTVVSLANDGKLSADQISEISTAQVVTSLTADQIALLQDAQKDNSLTADQKQQIQNAINAGEATQSLMNLVVQVSYKNGSLTQQQLDSLSLANIAGQISSSQISDMDAAKLTGQITGTQITDGAISSAKIQAASIASDKLVSSAVTADKLAANSVVAGKISVGAVLAQNLAAGSVTTSALAVGSAANLIANSCGDIEGAGTAGWWGDSNGNSTPAGVMSVSSPTVNGQIWNKAYLTGFGSIALGVNNLNSGVSSGYQMRIATPIAPVIPGKTYIFSVYANGFQWKSQMTVSWSDASGNYINNQNDGVGDIYATNINGDTTLATGYKRIWIRAVAPSNASYGGAIVIATATSNVSASSAYIVLSKAQISEVPAGSTEPPPWAAGGVSTIDGATIKTGSIYAGKIAASTITAAQIAGGTITAGQIAGYTIQGYNIAGNTITADKLVANSITAGQIAAGAIGADQIAGGSIQGRNIAAGTIYGSLIAGGTITADLLSGNTLIVSQAQIGNLVVGTSNLKDRSVTSYVATTSGKAWSISVSINCAQACVGIAGWYAYSTGSAPNLKFNLNVNGNQQFQATGYGGTGGSYGINLNQGNNTVQIDFSPGTQPDWLSLCVFGAMK